MNKNNQNFVFRSINYLSDFSNWKTILRSSYIYVILLAVYIPLFLDLYFLLTKKLLKENSIPLELKEHLKTDVIFLTSVETHQLLIASC